MKPILLSLLASTTVLIAAATEAPDRTLAWKTAEPADATARGEWWTFFADPVLDELVTASLVANQDLRAAAARVEQARAAAGVVRSGYWPQVAADTGLVREQTSSTTDNVFPNARSTTYHAPLGASWEIDLFGRVRHLTASARADAEATAAMFESVRLALTTDVAATYFSLRAVDQELGLVREGVRLRRRARELAQARFSNGTAAELDVARADTELASTEAEAAALANQRAAVQTALAVLVGAPAADFRLSASESPRSLTPRIPPAEIPSDLPAALLARRPDIAAAERGLAA